MSESRSAFQKLEICINTINHAFIGIGTFYIIWYCINYGFDKSHTLHALLTSLGFGLLMAEGIMSMYNGNTFTLFMTRSQKTNIHWVLQATGGILGLIGFFLEVVQRAQAGKKVFHIWHARCGMYNINILSDNLHKSLFALSCSLSLHLSFSVRIQQIFLGLVAAIFLGLSILSGCSALFSGKLKSFLRPIFSKFFHNLFAIVSFVFGIVAMIIAYNTRSFARNYDPGNIRYVMIGLLSCILIFTLIGPLKTLFKHLGLVFRSRASDSKLENGNAE